MPVACPTNAHATSIEKAGLAMPHGWHAGQALGCISGSAARTFSCKVPMLLT